jgi:hypothetical protein
MERFINVCYIFVVFLFFSCGSKGDDRDIFTEKDFAETIELKGELMQFDSMIMRLGNIHVFGNLLFLQNIRTNYHYEIYNLETNTKINECIRFGQGPGEMIRPKIVNIMDDSLWIYDMENMSLYNYGLKDFISASNPKIAKKVKLAHTHYGATVLSDNKIIASFSTVSEKTFDLYDSEGKLLESRGNYPNTKLSATQNILSYRFDFAAGPDDKIFVTYPFGDIIEIHDEKTGTMKRRWGPGNHKPVFKLITQGDASRVVPVSGETYQCYQNTPVSAGNEVFTLYYGDLYEKHKEVAKEKVTKILVFDFDGNPLRIYNLSIPIFAFDVDYEKRIIYGITDLPEEFNVVKFEY